MNVDKLIEGEKPEDVLDFLYGVGHLKGWTFDLFDERMKMDCVKNPYWWRTVLRKLLEGKVLVPREPTEDEITAVISRFLEAEDMPKDAVLVDEHVRQTVRKWHTAWIAEAGDE